MKTLIKVKKKSEEICGGNVLLLLDLRESWKITNERGTEIKPQNPEKVSLFNKKKIQFKTEIQKKFES